MSIRHAGDGTKKYPVPAMAGFQKNDHVTEISVEFKFRKVLLPSRKIHS